jgi:hypothetical protein
MFLLIRNADNFVGTHWGRIALEGSGNSGIPGSEEAGPPVLESKIGAEGGRRSQRTSIGYGLHIGELLRRKGIGGTVAMPCAAFFNTCLSPVSRSPNGLNIQAWGCMASTTRESALGWNGHRLVVSQARRWKRQGLTAGVRH